MRLVEAGNAEARLMDLAHKTEVAQEIIGVEAQLAEQLAVIRTAQRALFESISESLARDEEDDRLGARLRRR